MNDLWKTIVDQALAASEKEPCLASFYYAHIINHRSLTSSISFTLAENLGSAIAPATLIRDVVESVLAEEACIVEQIRNDLAAVYDRDPACDTYLMPLLFFKGFKALQCHRVSHCLWQQDRRALALFLQSIVCERFQVDIHPAATIGSGILLDHATSVVIGETAVVGDNVSMLHSVTLGGSGSAKQARRHPTIQSGVLVAAGSKILGPVTVGEGAKIAAGSVVVSDIEAHATAAGVPAKIVRRGLTSAPALDMQQTI